MGPMWYIGAAIGIVILAVVARAVRTIRRGNRLIYSIRHMMAAPGSVEAHFVDWLRENPNRTKQKDMFMQMMMGLGVSEAHSADCVLRCIVHSWTPDGSLFGQLLVGELEKHITWDDPGGDRCKVEVQQRGKQMFSQFKNTLLALDPP